MGADAIAPWDRLSAFNLPVETTYNLTSATPVLVAPGDPMRVALLFAYAAPSAAGVSLVFPVPIAYGILQVTSPISAAVVSTNPNMTISTGIAVPFLGCPFFIDSRYGPLVTQPWYALASNVLGVKMTVITQSMRSWPESNGTPDLSPEAYNAAIGAMANGYPNRVSRCKLYGNSWRQQQAAPSYGVPYLDDAGVCDTGDTGDS